MGVLQRLLGGMSLSKFADDYLDQKELHVSGSLPGAEIDRILSVETLESLYRRGPLARDKFQVISNGTVDSKPNLHVRGGIDSSWLASCYAKGSSLRITGIHDFVEQVSDLCRQLADECRCPVMANMYATPAGNPGFDPHYDDHDVLIIQCHGKKRWSFHDSYKDKQLLPLQGFEFDIEKNTAGPATSSVLLERGDVLYVPRGHMHSARADQDCHSVHLTLSLNWITWSELIFDALGAGVIEDHGMRSSVARTLMRADASVDDVVTAKCRELISRAVGVDSLRKSLESLSRRHDGSFYAFDAPNITAEKQV